MLYLLIFILVAYGIAPIVNDKPCNKGACIMAWILTVLMLLGSVLAQFEMKPCRQVLAFNTYEFVPEPQEHGKYKLFLVERKWWGMMHSGRYPVMAADDYEPYLKYLKNGKWERFEEESIDDREGYTDNRGFHEY